MAIQEWQKSLLRNWLTMHGVKEADADRFVSDPAVQDYARKAVAGDVPAPTDKQIAEYYSKGAKTGADPLTLFTADIAPKSPAAAASPAAPAEVPQPVAPTTQMAGGAPSPLGPLPPGTSIMEPSPGPLPSGIDIMAPSPGTLQSTPPPGFSGLDQPQIDLTSDAGMAGFAPVTPQGGGGMRIVKALDAGGGYTTVEYNDGTQETRKGNFAWRNNNPGNIEAGKFATAHGAIPGGGRFALFPDVATGNQARQALLFESPLYKDKTIAGAIRSYAPPSENDTAGYAQQLADAAGVSVNTKMSDLTPEQRDRMMQKQLSVEGNASGKVTTLKQGTGVGSDPFANVELQDGGVTPASWLSGGEYRPLGDGTQAPETLPIAPPPPSPSASDPFAGNVEPPPFTQGPTAAPPPPAPVLSAPVLGGGVGYDTLPPSADPSMMQRPLEPQLGQFGPMDLTPLPSMMQRPLEPPLGPLVPPVGGAPVLGGGMGGGLASSEDALGPLIDPNMPLPTRAPTPPIVSMPMPLQSMIQTPLEPQLPTSPMQIPTRSIYSSNMSPIDQPPMSSFDPAAAPPLGAPSYDMANTFDPSMSQYDMTRSFSPTQPPPATPQYDMANQFSPAMPQFDMANQFSPAPTPPATPQYDMANQFSPAMPQFDMANTFTPTPSGGPPGTTRSATEPSTFVPSGFGVASSSGFTPPPVTGMPGMPDMSSFGLPTPPPVPSSQSLANQSTMEPFNPLTAPTQGFDPTQGAPGVGGVPAMPSWAIPGAFGMGPNMPLGGTASMQFAGGTSAPTSMASSTGQYGGIGFNPATAPNGAIMAQMGPTGMFAPGGTNWADRMHGGVGGGPISEGASLNPAGTGPQTNAGMESHALQLMAAQDAANYANAMSSLGSHTSKGPPQMMLGGSDIMGLTGGIGMNRQLAQMWQGAQKVAANIPPPGVQPLIRPYGMNVGFNGPSFGSRF